MGDASCDGEDGQQIRDNRSRSLSLAVENVMQAIDDMDPKVLAMGEAALVQEPTTIPKLSKQGTLSKLLSRSQSKKLRQEARQSLWEKRSGSNGGPPSKGRDEAWWPSRLTFWWLTPLVRMAKDRPLSVENLWGLPSKHQAAGLVSTFDTEWEAQDPEKHSLIKAIMRAFKTQLIITAVFQAVQNASQLCLPLLIQQLLKWFENETEPASKGYMWAFLLFGVGMIGNGVIGNHNVMMQYSMGMDMRTTLNALVYRKSLRLSNKSQAMTTTGEKVTLLSNDAQRMPEMALSFHNIWATPIYIIVIVALLINLIGVGATMSGVAYLVVIMFCQALLAMKLMKVQRSQMKRTEGRLKLVNELLQGIKAVKVYAWEEPFINRLKNLRKVELDQVREFAYMNVKVLGMSTSTAYVMVLLTLVVYFLLDGDFNPATVFTAVSFLSALRMPLFMIPMTLATCVQGRVSMDRLQKYFELEEIDESGREWTNRKGGGQGSIEIKEGIFRWSTSSASDPIAPDKPEKVGAGGSSAKTSAVADLPTEEVKDAEVAQLEEEVETGPPFEVQVDLSVRPGQLVAVVGPVASGKSTLISSILGETHRESGSIKLDGSLAYVAQTAWITNDTLRSNVLMGTPMDQQRYEAVLEACDLVSDLNMLPANDLTEIGEKGINLSGGQKQRVSLARAVYANRDIYLFDDPLSAVDGEVANRIFEKCVTGLLKDKTRLLCLNQLQFLQSCDHVIALKVGVVAESGTFEELMAIPHGIVQTLMTSFGHDGDDEEADTAGGAGGEEARAGTGADSSNAKELAPQSQLSVAKGTEAGAKLVASEDNSKGSVRWQIYKSYFKDGSGGWGLPMLLLGVAFLTQATQNLFDWWLSQWTTAYLREAGQPPNYYIYVYIGLAVGLLVFVFTRGFLFAHQGIVASMHLHENLTTGVLRAPMSFFDTTPIGRILNRFSKDTDGMDIMLPRTLSAFVQIGSSLMGIFITIIVLQPWLAVAVLPVAYVYISVQSLFRPVSRDLQRLESISRSPIFAQFSETLTGVATIRAFGRQDDLNKMNMGRLDESNQSFLVMHLCNRWLQFRLEVLGSFVILFAAILIVLSRSSSSALSITAGVAGLLITYTQQITGLLNFTVRMYCQTEALITSVERIVEYAEITPEAPPKNKDYAPPTDFPAGGAITFKNYSMRYREGLDLVLKDVNMSIRAGEKVGIAGRTGSGKSSLLVALFRLCEPASGTIEIDGVDAIKLGLTDLRSAIGIIPQSPDLFMGTLRSNLDPFDRHSDADLWSALRSAHLSEYISSLEGKLEAPVDENGQNFSVGQRQLICLARAILRRSKILLLDEATANVDFETDTLIQKTIREEFAHATVLTIAHRLASIMDSDRIVVMESGRVAEFDTPANLVTEWGDMDLEDEPSLDASESAPNRGLLMKFIQSSGRSSSRRLLEQARGISTSLSTSLVNSTVNEEDGDSDQEEEEKVEGTE